MGKITENVLILLQEQFRHETSNNLRYTIRASWARFRGLEGIADFFDKEAEGESGHAAKVRKYIEDRNEALEPAPYAFNETGYFANVPELFTTALEVERGTTEKLQGIYAEAWKMGDYLTCEWLRDLLMEQIEEENTYQTILDRITAMGEYPARDHDLDAWIAERME